MACLILDDADSRGDQMYFDFNPDNADAFDEIESLLKKRKSTEDGIVTELAAVCKESFRQNEVSDVQKSSYSFIDTVRCSFDRIFRRKSSPGGKNTVSGKQSLSHPVP